MGLRRRALVVTTALCVVALVAVIATGCGSSNGGTSSGTSSTGAPSKGVVKIGVLAPLTGDSAADGQDMVSGAQLAADQINAKGGVAGYKLEVVPGDVKNQVPDAVVSAFQQLYNGDHVDVMMTGYASPTNFEIKNMANVNMPYIIGGNAAQTAAIIGKDGTKYPTVWSMVPSYDAYGTALPPLIESWATAGKLTLANKKVAVISSDNPYSQSIATGLMGTFRSLGWTITMDQTVPFGAVLNWGDIIAKIHADPPNVVIDTDYLPANDASFMNQFLQNPTKSLVFIQYGPSVPQFVQLTKANSTGVLYDLLGGPMISPKNSLYTAFQTAWQAKNTRAPGTYAEVLWESVNLYAQALQKVGDPKNHTAIGQAIGQATMTTPRGNLAFDPATHLAKQGDQFIPILFYQIWKGQRVLLDTQYSSGPFKLPPWMAK